MTDRGRYDFSSLRSARRIVLFASVLLMWPMSSTPTHSIWRSVQAAESARAAQQPQEVRLLELNKPIERELAGGQSHSYQFTLVADQYLLAIIEQRGINVLAQLLGPDNKPIAEFD